MEKGIKYDNEKPRWDLLDVRQSEKIVEVLTVGAKKYSENNWQSVVPFKKRYYSALKRHLSAYSSGEKYDSETGLTHLSHAATNLHFLMWGEDNLFNLERLRIGLDVDGVIADFSKGFCKRFNIDSGNNWWKHSYALKNNKIWDEISNDKSFWLELEPLLKQEDFPVEPICYITARKNAEWTKEWIELQKFATRPVISCYDKSKVKTIKEFDLDVFVDDKIEHYYEIKASGVRCFLMTQPWNARYKIPEYDRISSLVDLKKRL